ncbi:MAG TPA: hypothetical protein VGA87_01220, partial [Pyrinomonadaceae bacterium]
DFSAQVVEVSPSEESGVGDVDQEGGVRGKGTTKEDAAKVGAAAGVGAIIGAIAGGGKGAAIGAVIGAGAGAGSVYAQGRDHLELGAGTELILRAAGSR